MNARFETNVAEELPKTRMSQEPGLPWKVSEEDLSKVAAKSEDYKSAVSGNPPLKARAPFLVLLLVTIFVTTLYYISVSVMENEKIRENIQKKEVALVTLQADVQKINTEKEALSQSVSQLEKKVNDLNSQKALYATVIESLAKKSDDSPSDR